jgi:hypothetical protein
VNVFPVYGCNDVTDINFSSWTHAGCAEPSPVYQSIRSNPTIMSRLTS